MPVHSSSQLLNIRPQRGKRQTAGKKKPPHRTRRIEGGVGTKPCELGQRQQLGNGAKLPPNGSLLGKQKQKGNASSVTEPTRRPPLKPGQFHFCKCGCPTYYELHKPFCSAECRFNLTGTANYPADKKPRGKRKDEQRHFYFHAHGNTQGTGRPPLAIAFVENNFSSCVSRKILTTETPYGFVA